jgi:hypothetical protein
LLIKNTIAISHSGIQGKHLLKSVRNVLTKT